MTRVASLIVWLFLFTAASPVLCEATVSDSTQECLDCHEVFHPGIVSGWRQSRHSKVPPGEALKVNGLSRKISIINSQFKLVQ